MDILTPVERSKRMRLVKSEGTQPELIARRIIRGLHYRFRSHIKELPGSPDFVFPDRKKVVFVHGCFWHQHSACREDHRPRSPKSRKNYWRTKLQANLRRDRKNQRALNRLGWSYLVVWECMLRNKSKVAKIPARINSFLKHNRD